MLSLCFHCFRVLCPLRFIRIYGFLWIIVLGVFDIRRVFSCVQSFISWRVESKSHQRTDVLIRNTFLFQSYRKIKSLTYVFLRGSAQYLNARYCSIGAPWSPFQRYNIYHIWYHTVPYHTLFIINCLSKIKHTPQTSQSCKSHSLI